MIRRFQNRDSYLDGLDIDVESYRCTAARLRYTGAPLQQKRRVPSTAQHDAFEMLHGIVVVFRFRDGGSAVLDVVGTEPGRVIRHHIAH